MDNSARRRGTLVLADGKRFDGFVTGGGTLPVWGEVVFNTSMTGYQEVITDPSYAGQIVVMTYPEIGNYGVLETDSECVKVASRALVVHELSPFFSPGPGRTSLPDFMNRNELPGLDGIDTRALALHIRRDGAVMGAIGGPKSTYDELARLARSKAEVRQDLVASVTGAIRAEADTAENGKQTAAAAAQAASARVAVIDFGAKSSIVDAVKARGTTKVFDAFFDADTVLGGAFDGVVLSNGPGDPTDVPDAVENVKRLIGKVPILGICLGYQVAALALGGHTYKLKFGHRGANQPVKNVDTGRVHITSQNHGYAVDDDIAEIDGVKITYRNTNDGTLEGFRHEACGIDCVQFHPEAAPGPQDTTFIFDAFFERIGRKQHAQA